MVHSLFGKKAVIRNTTSLSVDHLLMKTPFGFNLDNEEEEDIMFLTILNIIKENVDPLTPMSSSRLLELAQIIEKRLPVESHVTTLYKQRTAALSKQQKANNTPLLVIRRIKLILTEARTLIREALVWNHPARNIRTNQTGKIITSSPSTNTNTSCASCGYSSHNNAACPYLKLAGTNFSSEKRWAQSSMGKAWKAAGFDQFQPNLPVPKGTVTTAPKPLNTSSSSSSSSSSMPRGYRIFF